ncbi:MAG: enoyl-CoA hydratase/isomerase family protein, partial [Vicinamibacteria bacterium]
MSFLRALPLPTLCSINGVAAGSGLGVALARDLRIASRAARLGATFSRIGLHPDWGGSYFLTRLTSPAVARDLIFSGAPRGCRQSSPTWSYQLGGTWRRACKAHPV